MTPDVNVLVAAFHADHPHHAVARGWLDAALQAMDNGHSALADQWGLSLNNAT